MSAWILLHQMVPGVLWQWGRSGVDWVAHRIYWQPIDVAVKLWQMHLIYPIQINVSIHDDPNAGGLRNAPNNSGILSILLAFVTS